MSSLVYLLERTFVNKLKKALKRPVTYIAVLGIGLYIALILWSFGMMAEDFGLKSAGALPRYYPY